MANSTPARTSDAQYHPLANPGYLVLHSTGAKTLECDQLADFSPVTCGISHRQEDRLVLSACLLESFFTPGIPVHLDHCRSGLEQVENCTAGICTCQRWSTYHNFRPISISNRPANHSSGYKIYKGVGSRLNAYRIVGMLQQVRALLARKTICILIRAVLLVWTIDCMEGCCRCSHESLRRNELSCTRLVSVKRSSGVLCTMSQAGTVGANRLEQDVAIHCRRVDIAQRMPRHFDLISEAFSCPFTLFINPRWRAFKAWDAAAHEPSVQSTSRF